LTHATESAGTCVANGVAAPSASSLGLTWVFIATAGRPRTGNMAVALRAVASASCNEPQINEVLDGANVGVASAYDVPIGGEMRATGPDSSAGLKN
jgi:hypothetical protein